MRSWWPAMVLFAAAALNEAVLEMRTLSWTEDTTGVTAAKPILRIGTSLTLDCCSKYSKLGRALRQAYELFFEQLERNGGVVIGGVRHSIELVLADDASDPSRVRRITRRLTSPEWGVRLLLGPYSSSLTEPAALVAHDVGAVLVAPGASASSVFKDRPRVFGTLTPSSRFLASTFQALQGRTSAVAYLQESAGAMPAICNSVPELANLHGMELLQGVSVSDDASQEEVSAAVGSLSTAASAAGVGTNEGKKLLVVGCVYYNVCKKFLAAAKKEGFTPHAIALTICVTTPGFLSEVGDAGRFVLGVTQWIPDLPLTSELTTWSAGKFASEYIRRYGEVPPYQAASAWASAAALISAVQTADSTEAGFVADALARMSSDSLFGHINFDGHGQCTEEFKVIQYQVEHHGDLPMLVAPSGIVGASELVFPMPTWLERECLYSGEDGLYGIDEKGLCHLCTPGTISRFRNTTLRRHCEPCLVGEHWEIYREQRLCTPCSPGRFADAPSSTQCEACPPGEFTLSARATGCEKCAPGSVSSSPGSMNCTLCEPGRYQPGSGNHSCLLCPAGSYSEAGFSSCIPCSSGRYGNQKGLEKCLNCSEGHAQSLSGRTGCEGCEPGFYEASSGSTSCAKCPGGNSMTDGFRASSSQQCGCPLGMYLRACPPGVDQEAACMTKACISGPCTAGGLECLGWGPPQIKPGYMLDWHSVEHMILVHHALPEAGLAFPEKLRIFRCQDKIRCPGVSFTGQPPSSWSNVCPDLHRGIACEHCPLWYYTEPDGNQCIKCNMDEQRMAVYTLGLALPFMLLYLYHQFNIQQISEQEIEHLKVVEHARDVEFAAAGGHWLASHVRLDPSSPESFTVPASPRSPGSPQVNSSAARREQQSAASQVESSRIMQLVKLFRRQVIFTIQDAVGLLAEFCQTVAVIMPLVDWEAVDMESMVVAFKPLRYFVAIDMPKLLAIAGIQMKCWYDLNFAQLHAVSMMIPFLWICLFVFNWLIFHCFLGPILLTAKKCCVTGESCICRLARWILSQRVSGDKTINAIGMQMTGLFIGLSSAVFALVLCDPNPGGMPTTLRRNPDILCNSSQWYEALPVGALSLLIYTVGVLASVAYIIAIAPHRYHHVQFRTRFFFIFDDIRPEMYWWKLIVLLRALALNIVIVAFQDARIVMVALLVLFMMSNALLFLYHPWTDPVLIMIDRACHVSLVLLLSCVGFHLKDYSTTFNDDEKYLYWIEIAALALPGITTLFGAAYPLYRFVHRVEQRANTYRLGQMLRDTAHVICRQPNRELNVFLGSLEHAQQTALERAMDIVHASILRLQPWKVRKRLIVDAPTFDRVTEEDIIGLLAETMKCSHDPHLSVRERALAQRFVDDLSDALKEKEGPQKRSSLRGNGTSKDMIDKIFRHLDLDSDGVIFQGEFVHQVLDLVGARAHWSAEEISAVFGMADTRRDGKVTRDEFRSIFGGMTFHHHHRHKKRRSSSSSLHEKSSLAQKRLSALSDSLRHHQLHTRKHSGATAEAACSPKRNGPDSHPTDDRFWLKVEQPPLTLHNGGDHNGGHHSPTSRSPAATRLGKPEQEKKKEIKIATTRTNVAF